MRLKSFDNYLITLMSAIALLCIYMLYGTKLVNFNSESIVKVAQIEELLKTVKRKKDFYQGWADVKPGDALSEDEEIYTHGQSSAKIRFTNGPEISLFENSLLRIKSGKAGNSLHLDKGNLIAKLTKESPQLNIELSGKKYSFKSDNASIQIEQSKTENKFLLLDGKAKLSDQEILPNQIVIQNIQTGELKIKKIPFISKLPNHNSTIYFKHEVSVHFAWNYTNMPVPARLIIARDSKFTDIVSDETTEYNVFNSTIKEAGTYYWKVSGVDQDEGPIKSFTLIEEMPPILNADRTGLYQGPKSSEKVFLSWSKNLAKNFTLKIESPNGKIEQIETQKNTYEYLPTELGIHKVAIKIKDEGRPLALWSESVNITLNEARAIEVSSITPETIERVHYNNGSVSYLLSWNGPSSGVSYQVRVSKNNKSSTLSTEQTSVPLNLKEAGIYNWEIQGETSSGVLSNKISGKIVIKTPLHITQLPSEGAVVELEKPDQLVSFKWDKVQEATQYQFELSDDPSFKKIILDRELDSNNVSTTLAEVGRYFWRVKIKKGENIEYSRPVSVEIKPTPPLSAPEISPDIKIKLKYEDKSSSFHFIDLFIAKAQAAGEVAIAEWDLPANPKAKSYIVEVYKDQSLKELVFQIETQTPHVVWKNATVGNFYWRVAYTDFWGRKTDFSKLSVLSTEDIEPVKPQSVEIELNLPKHKADILKEEKDQATLSWTHLPEIVDYEILIARDLEFENIVVKKTLAKNEFKINCKVFDNRSGEYYWKITSGINSSKRRLFSVKCETPQPPPSVEPVNVEAEQKTEVSEPKTTIEELKPVAAWPVKRIGRHFLKVGFLPQHVSYENKSSQYKSEVDGNALDSWFISYERPTSFKYIEAISPALNVSRGKVFKDITFTDVEFSLKGKKKESHFTWGPMAVFMKKTLYVEENLAITNENISAPLIGIFIQKRIQGFTMNAEIKAGSMISLHGDVEYKMKNNFALGAFVESTSISKNGNKHSFMNYGINLNYTFDFLDNVK